jgi:hypothetical protein
MSGQGAWVLALIGVGMISLPARADFRIAFKETYSAGTATRMDYYKGNLWRTDWGAGAIYTIADSGSKRSVTIDPASHTYSVHTFTPKVPAPNSPETIVVEIEARDAGEQRQMFGHVTHHIVTTQRRHTESQGRSMADDREMTIDGWYMDLNLPIPAYSRSNSVAALYVAVDQHGRSDVPKIQIVRKGPVPRGLPVWEKAGDTLTEVTEFLEAPLDASVFEVPAGYRRVVHPFLGQRLAWDDWLLFQWQQFEDWLSRLL